MITNEKILACSILEMIAAVGGKIDSRLRLQKSAYLLKYIGSKSFSEADFDYEARGPYSRELSDALHDIIAAGLLSEIKEESDNGSYCYCYHLTPQGKEWLEKNLSEADKLLWGAVNFFKNIPSDVLELSSIVLFLSGKRGIANKAEAFELAIERKPSFVKWRSQTEKFIEQITRWRSQEALPFIASNSEEDTTLLKELFSASLQKDKELREKKVFPEVQEVQQGEAVQSDSGTLFPLAPYTVPSVANKKSRKKTVKPECPDTKKSVQLCLPV